MWSSTFMGALKPNSAVSHEVTSPLPSQRPLQPELHVFLYNRIPSKISSQKRFLPFRFWWLLLLLISKHSPVRKAHCIKFFFILEWPSYFLLIIWHLCCPSLPSIYPWVYCGDTLSLHVTFCTLVQPFLEFFFFFFCYWHRTHSRSWPTFLVCLPMPFPGRILGPGSGAVTQGSTTAKRRCSDFSAIHSDDGSYHPCFSMLSLPG